MEYITSQEEEMKDHMRQGKEMVLNKGSEEEKQTKILCTTEIHLSFLIKRAATAVIVRNQRMTLFLIRIIRLKEDQDSEIIPLTKLYHTTQIMTPIITKISIVKYPNLKRLPTTKTYLSKWM